MEERTFTMSAGLVSFVNSLSITNSNCIQDSNLIDNGRKNMLTFLCFPVDPTCLMECALEYYVGDSMKEVSTGFSTTHARVEKVKYS